MSRLTDTHKLWTGYTLGGVILINCLVISGRSGTTASLHVLLCLLGGAVGWAVGIVAPPFAEPETRWQEGRHKIAHAPRCTTRICAEPNAAAP
jgi:hypothetical protein